MIPKQNLEQSRQTYQPDAKTRTTEEDMLDAMCIWEAMLEVRLLDKDDATDLSKVWENYGAWQMRQHAADMVPVLQQVFDRMSLIVEDTMAYDWEFVPMFLSSVRWPVEANKVGVIEPDMDAERIVAEMTARIALKPPPTLL